MTEMNVTADLLNSVAHVSKHGQMYYTGHIYNDKKKRWPDGTSIRTSLVVDTRDDVIVTLNSVYRLI